jgi:hypothetical protein
MFRRCLAGLVRFGEVQVALCSAENKSLKPGNETRKVPPVAAAHSDEKRLFVYKSKASSNFAVRRQSAEEYLHQARIVPLNENVDVYDMKGNANCDGSICPKHLSEAQLASIPIFVISGTYGDNRRVFAVTSAATYGLEHLNQSKCTTLYLKPHDVFFYDRSRESPEKLVAWIKHEISATCGSSKKLNMHVSLVLEQVLPYPGGFFHQKKNLIKIVELLRRDVADSVRLVVCGDGYTDENFPDDEDSFLIQFRDERYFWHKPVCK